MKICLFLLSALLLTRLAFAQATESNGAYCSGTISYTYYCSPTGTGNGSSTSDPCSLTTALTKATQNKFCKANGTGGTKVILMNGNYTSSLNASYYNQNDRYTAQANAIVIEAQNAHQAIISGADRWNTASGHTWTEWQTTDCWGTYWSYDWGTSWPDSWPDIGEEAGPTNELCKRREMVFVDGTLLKQVLSWDELAQTDGSFAAWEGNDVLYVNPPGNRTTNPNTANTQVALRGNLLELQNINNVTVRGIDFKYETSSFYEASSRVLSCSNVLIEDCAFDYSHWVNLGILYCNYITLRKVTSDHGGGTGLSTGSSWDLLYDDCTTRYNAWRGPLGGFWGWDTGGVKDLHNNRATYRGLVSTNNLWHGYWMDGEGHDLVLDHCIIADNDFQGVDLECVSGPVWIKHCMIANNKAGGLHSAISEDVTVEKCVIYGNYNQGCDDTQEEQAAYNSQLPFAGPGTRWIGTLNEATFTVGEPYVEYRDENWDITDNIIVGTNSTARINGVTCLKADFDYWKSTSPMNYNQYYNASSAYAFTAYHQYGWKERKDFTGWKAYINDDANSVWSDPNFTDAANKKFLLSPFQDIDFDSTIKKGFAFYSRTKSQFTLGGAGAIASADGYVDQGHFAYKPFTNGTVVLKIESMEYTNANAWAGIMLRGSTAANAKCAFLSLTASGWMQLTKRDSDGGAMGWASGAWGSGFSTPYWMKLTYNNSTYAIHAYTAPVSDPNNWTELGTGITLNLGSNPIVGPAVSSYVSTKNCKAVFSNFSTF